MVVLVFCLAPQTQRPVTYSVAHSHNSLLAELFLLYSKPIFIVHSKRYLFLWFILILRIINFSLLAKIATPLNRYTNTRNLLCIYAIYSKLIITIRRIEWSPTYTLTLICQTATFMLQIFCSSNFTFSQEIKINPKLMFSVLKQQITSGRRYVFPFGCYQMFN